MSSLLDENEFSRKQKAVEAKRLYLEGYKTKEIADKLGVSRETANTYLIRIGVPRNRKLTESLRSRERAFSAKKLYLEGVSAEEIRKRLNITNACLGRYLRSHGISRRKNSTKYTQTRAQKRSLQRQKEVRDLYQKGLIVSKIKEQLKISTTSVRNFLKNFDPYQQNQSIKKSNWKQIAEEAKQLYLEGMTITGIARKLGFTKSKISNYLDKQNLFGIRLRKKKKESENKAKYIKKAYYKNDTLSQIASQCNCTERDVLRYLKKERVIPDRQINIIKKVKKKSNRAKEMYLEGVKMEEICKKLGVSSFRVQEYAVQHKVSGFRMKKIREKRAERAGLAKELYKSGISAVVIAEVLSVSVSSVYRYVRTQPIPESEMLYPTFKKAKKAEELYLKGQKLSEIAKNLNISMSCLSSYLKRLKVSRERSKKISQQSSRKASLAKEMYLKGIKIEEIQKKIQISNSTLLTYYLKKEGLSNHRQKKIAEKSIEKSVIVQNLYLEGLTVIEIAEQENISETTVYKYLKLNENTRALCSKTSK